MEVIYQVSLGGVNSKNSTPPRLITVARNSKMIQYTLSETNMAPEYSWLEDLPFGMAYFRGLCLVQEWGILQEYYKMT